MVLGKAIRQEFSFLYLHNTGQVFAEFCVGSFYCLMAACRESQILQLKLLLMWKESPYLGDQLIGLLC